ncbi:CytochromeB1 [Capsicum baccatum]|uniref:CytochromeB1 n=1 Tax=Capsicum baccatum TaxID=33114 RepID=A0A2G2W5U9_CAPBA|nr:CytochromeB1 [Capsicum baccatum]
MKDNGSVDDFVISITEEVLEKMHYLHATLTETLRLYPAVLVDGRCADADDVLPDGFHISKGDGVYYLSYAMGRMPYIWGNDAEDFRPERWLKGGIFQPESPFKFIAFHAGPRICLGKDFAYRQMKILSMALLHFFRIYIGKSIRNPKYAPVVETVFHQLFCFKTLYDYQTEVAKKTPTSRLLLLEQSEIYTTNSRNIEHILKTNFGKYSKGKQNQEVIHDLFGKGIFAVDGEKWKQQRKLASLEFSARVLRDFSCTVFRKGAAKLVGKVFELSVANHVFDMQELLMRCSLDSIFKVGFGVDLNCLDGSSGDDNEFIKAFDDSNALTYCRYVDPFWKLKRYFNIGSEFLLKENIKFIGEFVDESIRTRRKHLEMK